MSHHLAACILLGTILAWDHAGHSTLRLFLLYVRGAGQSYAWDAPTVPVTIEEGHLTTSIRCETLPLISAGPWWAVVTALDASGERTKPSNEVQFWFDPLKGCVAQKPAPAPPIPPPPASPPPVVMPPPASSPGLGQAYPPLVWTPPPVPPLPAPPPSSGSGSGWISDSCVWNGTCP